MPKDEDHISDDDSDDDMNTTQARKKNKKPKRRDIPVKVCWYLTIISRLKQLYSNPETVELMRWHAEKCTDDGMLRHPSDSPQWRNMDRKFPDKIGLDKTRNVRFALSTDGMNPFGNMSTTHRTWPVNMHLQPSYMVVHEAQVHHACNTNPGTETAWRRH